MSENAIDTETEVEEAPPTSVQKLMAELLGTFVLVFFGCGAAIVSAGDYVATGLTFGLTVVTMAYAYGRVSGGHFNPAVTMGAAVGGRLPWRDVPMYWGAQIVGGIVAGFVLWVTMHGFPGFDSTTGGFATNGFGDQSANNYAWWAALILELVLTCVFLLVILGVTDSRNEHPALAPLAIGLALAMIHFASMGATGTSVNPARSIGVGVFAGADHALQLWLFIVAPLLGGALAGILYPLIFGGAPPIEGSGLSFARAPQDPAYADAYQQQWNQGGYQAPYGQQWPQNPGQNPAQQPGQQPGWGQPPPQSWPQNPAQQPGQGQPQQWGAPPAGQPGQWQGGPPAGGQPQQWGEPSGGQPQQWGEPGGEEDGRTQIRPDS